MESIFSMIVELDNTVNFSEWKYRRIYVPKHALSCTSCQGENPSSDPAKAKGWSTHVSHESIKGSLVQTISIPTGCCFRQTKPPFRFVVIHWRDCDFSTDQVGRASSGRLAVSCHLRKTSVIPVSNDDLYETAHDSTCSFRLPFVV
jgi:hypothetical protein